MITSAWLQGFEWEKPERSKYDVTKGNWTGVLTIHNPWGRNSGKSGHRDMMHTFLDSVWLIVYKYQYVLCGVHPNVHKICLEIVRGE